VTISLPATNGLIVFSDLDGTLLDHETYDWSHARPALSELEKGGHCLVLASSKTAAEIAPLRAATGFSHCPAIVENGAGILPAGDTVVEGGDHAMVMDALAGLPESLRKQFSGFSNWSVEEIARRTGLKPEDAANAGRRQFSEPGIWSGRPEDLQAFADLLGSRGVVAQQGGRFLTLSLGVSKADRMLEIVSAARLVDPSIRSVALGDAPNDIAMIEAADLGFIIANPSHQGIAELSGEPGGRIQRTAEAGPKGWNTAVLSVINSLSS
jgi:mannosyl-3-phosphoglycerate phosphatase